MCRVSRLADRAAAYGIPAELVDGNDVEAIYAMTVDAATRCRAGKGPVLIEAETYRWHGHYEGDAQPYKPEDEADRWRAADPLEAARRRLAESHAAATGDLDEVVDEARRRVETAVEHARASNPPSREEAFEHVFAG